jgi:hypothetical protein
MSKGTEASGVHAKASEPEPNLEMLSKTLAGVQDQIRFSDTKAGFVAALNILFFGFIASQADKLASISPANRHAVFWWSLVLLALYSVGTFISIVLVIFSVMPRFGELAPQCKTHFAHVLKNYGKDYGKYCEDVKAMTVCDWADDLGSQIVEVCHIAAVKHRLVRRAAIWTIVSFVFWIAALVTITFGR